MNKLNCKKLLVSPSKILFYFSYFLLLTITMCSKVTFIETKLKYLKLISTILLLVNCIIQSRTYNKKTLLKNLIFIILGVISYYISKDSTIFYISLLVFLMKNIEFDDLVKKDFYMKIILTLIVILCYFLGYTDEFISYRDGIARISFGFSHANVFGFIVSFIAIEFIYLKRDKIKYRYCIPMIILLFIINYYSDSRASFILFLLIIITYLLQKTKIIKIIYMPITKKIISNSFIIFTVLTFIMTYLYAANSSVGIWLNSLFSSRLYHIYRFLNQYDINLFGNNLVLISTAESILANVKPWILDNSFIHIMLRYGIIVYGVFAFYYKKMFKFAYKEKNTILIMVFFLLAFYGLMETYLFKFTYNVFILYIGKIIYLDENNSESNNKIT